MPHVILVMADDQGWGQTGYQNHPTLQTPHLDAMAAEGLRFNRFYAGGPVCSPTRASVLTGRTHDRTGVRSHGYALQNQERSLATAMRDAGYHTGHFGKWHLNGLRGPGAPVLAADQHRPGAFGFDDWLSTTNFFDRDPLLSRRGKIESFHGDSSEIVVDEAIQYFERQLGKPDSAGQPLMAVIWFGTPHSPFRATDEDNDSFGDVSLDKIGFQQLPEAKRRQILEQSRNQHGELTAMDRAVGTLRQYLKDSGIERDT
ncbi:MAG: sulfatase-like hydrolase/transferase, partial [Planctomycetota bacterium]